MSRDYSPTILKVGLPKGRMQSAVLSLLGDAGIRVGSTERGYRPSISLPDAEAKIFKPQDVVEMLELGRRDVGFAGADWVCEMKANVAEVLDTGLDPVTVVAAAPVPILSNDGLPKRRIIVASEYESLTRDWIQRRNLDATFVHTHGATEVFPPEDADVVVDNTATGSTLRANGLTIIDTLQESSTRLYASRSAMEDPSKRDRIERLRLVLASVLDARRRVLVEVNAPAENLEAIVSLLPCMRQATVAPLYGNSGYAVKVAVSREELFDIIPAVKAAGGTDIVVTNPSQIVP